MPKLTVQSDAFKSDGVIPTQYTEDGQNISPALRWSDVPAEARELAMIVDDPDAPRPQPWVHWVIYKIPPSVTSLKEAVAKDAKPREPAGVLQGKNSWGRIGYDGPAPPKGHGVHHYHFRLYALDTAIDLGSGATKETLLQAMRGHIRAEGELVGTYQR